MNKKAINDATHSVSKNISAEIEEVHGGYWEKRYDIAKMMITLSSSIIVVEVTFYKKNVLDFSDGFIAPISMVASWVAIFLSLLFAVACLKATMEISAHKLRLFYAMQFASEETFAAKLSGKNLADKILKDTYVASKKVFDEILIQDKNANKSIKTSIYCLAIAIALLMAFGIFSFEMFNAKEQHNDKIKPTANMSVLSAKSK